MNQVKDRSLTSAASVPPDSVFTEQLLDGTTPLPASQVPRLCTLILAEPDSAKQRHYWSILLKSAPSSKALDLALDFIMNPGAINRGEAVRYLRFYYPDRLPGLLDAFSRDPDEEMRYQLSEFLRDSDQDAAVGMKIGMLATAGPALQETLIHEISQFGTLWHLEALEGRDALAGGNSPFGRAASLLAARIKTSNH